MKITDINNLLKQENDNLKEQFKLKSKKNKKKKLDELKNKEKTMNESYKVYNTIGGECVSKGDFNSWQEVEQYLNKEWGSYTNQMCKENPSFNATEEDKLNFFASYDIMPIEVEASNLGDNETECPICGCTDCICDGTTCEVDLGTEITPDGEVIDTTIEPPAEVITMVDEEPAEENVEPAEEQPEEEEGMLEALVKEVASLLEDGEKPESDVEVETEKEDDNADHSEDKIEIKGKIGDTEFEVEQELNPEAIEQENKEAEEEEVEEEPLTESNNQEFYVLQVYTQDGKMTKKGFNNIVDAVDEYKKAPTNPYKEIIDTTQLGKSVIMAQEGTMPQGTVKVEEDFKDEMAMLTDIANTDFPKPLADTVPTNDEGEVLDIGDLAKQLAELTDEINKAISDLKTDIKLNLQDVKQELKQEVSQVATNVENEVGSIPDAIEDLTDEEADMADVEYVDDTEEGEPADNEEAEKPAETEEPAEEEKSDEEDKEEELGESLSESDEANQGAFVMLQDGTNAEVIEILTNEDGSLKGYKVKVNNADEREVKPEEVKDILDEHVSEEEKSYDFSAYLKRGVMEDLSDIKNKIVDLVKNNSPVEVIKNNIEMFTDNDKDKEDAKDFAVDELNKEETKNETFVPFTTEKEAMEVASLTESLLQSKYKSKLGECGIDLNGHGITLNP